MKRYYSEIAALFDIYEKEEHLTEKEIYERCLVLIKNHNFDRDYMYDIRDVVIDRGYGFIFDVPNNKKKKFSEKEYVELMTNVTKSLDKTKNLIQYLNDVNDARVFFASIYALKVKYLIELGYLPSDNDWINENINQSIRDLYFISLDEGKYDETEIIEKAFNYCGLEYLPMFWIDMEHLLWTIELVDKNGMIKVNTIKVAFGIAPKALFIRGEKLYYDPSFSKKLNSYLKLVDQDLLKDIKKAYENKIDDYHLDGYKLLYNVL